MACAPAVAATPRSEADRLADSAQAVPSELRPSEARKAWTKALAAATQAYGPKTMAAARALNGLAAALWADNQGDEAISKAVAALAIEDGLRQGQTELAGATAANLGAFYNSRHKFDLAEPLLRRALEGSARLHGERSIEAAASSAELAVLLTRTGRTQEALVLFAKAVEIDRALLPPKADQRIQNQIQYASAIVLSGDHRRAEAMMRQAVADSADLPDDHPRRVLALEGIGIELVQQGRLEEAAEIYRKVVDQRRRTGKLADRCDALGTLAFVRLDQERLDDAEALFQETRACFQSASNATMAAVMLMNLGTVAARGGDQALGLQRRAGALAEIEAQAKPSFVATTLVKYKLADSLAATGDLKAALKTEREAAEALRSFRSENNPQRITADVTLGWIMALDGDARAGLELAQPAGLKLEAESRKLEIAQVRTTGVRDNLEGLGRILRTAQLADDREAAFHFAQVLVETDAGRAAAAESARRAAGKGPVADALRRRQALMEERLRLDEQYLTTKSDAAAAAPLLARIAAIDQGVAEAEAALDSGLPRYRALTHPSPIRLAEVQEKLSADEALIVPVSTDEGLITLAVSRTATAIDRSPLTRRQVRDLVRRLRAGVTGGDGLRAAVDAGGGANLQAPAFDRKAAYDLYRAIFTDKVRALTDRARTYTLASSEAFSALPFAMLVTQEPKGGDRSPQALRTTSWLIRKAAIQVAPSIPAMRLARDEGHGGGGFFGAGDPSLSGGQTPGPAAGYFRGSGAELVAVKGLPPLPGSAGELRDMARTLGAKHSQLLLGQAATEAAVRSADLSHASIVAFATHGLVAGDLGGLAEPALVFTPPAEASEADDALLTASEAAQLELNADWVILSACNTAAGETGQSPGYTGLARAFMLAGGRRVLASHWPVRDDAAARLTVDTVRASARGRTPAQALRKAMLRLMDDRSIPDSADPSVWAPFVVVGR